MSNGFNLHKEEPGISDVLNQIKLNILANLNCHNIGKILEFDKDTQTCTVELMQLKQFNGRTYSPAPITQVPLVIYGAANGHITLPNPVGTICLLFFNDRNMDNFLLTGEQYIPDTTRMHDFTDCIAITTFKTLANPLTDYDERAVSIINEEIINEIKYNSYIKVYGNSVEINSLNTNDNINSHISISPVAISATTTDFNVSVSNQISNSSTLGGQITVNNKIGISNTNQNLNNLIQAFLTACENITTLTDEAGGGLSPDSKQAFTNLKTQFGELLQ